jgi:hypothetical protein
MCRALERVFRESSRRTSMNANKLLHSLVPLLLIPACVTDDVEVVDLGEIASAITPTVAPIDTFEIRADRVIYLGNDGSGVRAYELDRYLSVLRKSAALASVSAVENLTTDGSSVLFGDGARNVRLSLLGKAPQTFDSYGVFGKNLRGIGGVTLRDGTLSRVINGNGFGLSTLSPVEAFSGAQKSAVPVLSTGARAYVSPSSNYLRHVDVDSQTSSLICKSSTSYASSKTLATAHDQQLGSVRVAAKLADGTLADCRRTPKFTSVSVVDLPFEVGDVAFEGGGGVGYEGGGGLSGYEPGGGLGIWVASAETAEVAYIGSTGKVTIIPMVNKLGITPIPIPRVVRSFSDGSALVLMSNHQFRHVPRPY